MSVVGEATTDPRDAKVSLVLDVLSRDGQLTAAEVALLEEVGRVPEVREASAKRDQRVHLARVTAARAIEAERQSERTIRVEARRQKWREASVFVRALFVVAERLGEGSQIGKAFVMLAELLLRPKLTLQTRGGDERPPPVRFEPSGFEHDDPVTE